MKFTAFVLATAAVTASAQTFFNNPFVGGQVYQPYPVQYPVQQPYYPAQPYPIAVPQPVDPLAWERDCTWINSVAFRAALSRATCGVDVCVAKGPNGNGGGHQKRDPAATSAEGGYNVWGTVINRAGRVCAIAYTGNDLSQQFPYGRILSAKLANTANSLSLPGRAQPSHVRHLYPDNNRGLRQVGSGNHYYLGGGLMRTGMQSTDADKLLVLGQGHATLLNAQQQTAGAANTGVIPPAAAGALGGTQENADSIPRFANGGANDGHFHVSRGINHNQDFRFKQLFDSELDDELASDNSWWGFTLPAEQFNPGNVDVHYQGAASNYGEACGTTRQDPLCMQKPGGMVYSAGGLALYDAQGVLRGAIGVAGDNDCANHAIAWKAREQLSMDYTPGSTDEWRNFPRSNVAEQTAGATRAQIPRLGFNKGTVNMPDWAGESQSGQAIVTLAFTANAHIRSAHAGVAGAQGAYGADNQLAGHCAAFTAAVAPAPASVNPCFIYFASDSSVNRATEVHHNPAWNQYQNRIDTFLEHGTHWDGMAAYAPAANGPYAQIGHGMMKSVKWAGKKAEDNAIFSETEQMNFPLCQRVITNFATTNPTDNSMFSTGK